MSGRWCWKSRSWGQDEGSMLVVAVSQFGRHVLGKEQQATFLHGYSPDAASVSWGHSCHFDGRRGPCLLRKTQLFSTLRCRANSRPASPATERYQEITGDSVSPGFISTILTSTSFYIVDIQRPYLPDGSPAQGMDPKTAITSLSATRKACLAPAHHVVRITTLSGKLAPASP